VAAVAGQISREDRGQPPGDAGPDRRAILAHTSLSRQRARKLAQAARRRRRRQSDRPLPPRYAIDATWTR
jgi:hypothetical protein